MLCEKFFPFSKVHDVNNLGDYVIYFLVGRLDSNVFSAVLDVIQSVAYEEQCIFACISLAILEEEI